MDKNEQKIGQKNWQKRHKKGTKKAQKMHKKSKEKYFNVQNTKLVDPNRRRTKLFHCIRIK